MIEADKCVKNWDLVAVSGYIMNKIDANQRLSFETFAKRVDGNLMYILIDSSFAFQRTMKLC